AEIAAGYGLQPDDELVEDRQVESVERPQPVDINLAGAGRNHHRHRVAGNDAEEDEYDQSNAEQRRWDEKETTENGTAAHDRTRNRLRPRGSRGNSSSPCKGEDGRGSVPHLS